MMIVKNIHASNITLNKAWVHAIQELAAAHEWILTASGSIDGMTITGQGYVTIIDIRFKCKYAPRYTKV